MNDNAYKITDGREYVNREAINGAYLDLINDAFGFTKNGEDFRRLLPKLFGKNRDAAAETTFAEDVRDGSLVACAGRFPVDFTVCGRKLKAFGIGNVCTLEKVRGNGLMSAVMTEAVRKMAADGAALSFLGGSRFRYRRFGFEKCGVSTTFEIEKKSLDGLLPRLTDDYSLEPLSPDDKEACEYIVSADPRPYHAERKTATVYDTLCSWHSVPYLLKKSGSLAGWAVANGDSYVTEAICPDPADLAPLIAAVGRTLEKIIIRAPEYYTELYDLLYSLSSGWHSGGDNCFCILDYTGVVSAMLELRSTYRALADGTLTLIIEGIAGTEAMRINVSDGTPSVSAVDPAEASREGCMRLGHFEAMNLLFSDRSPQIRMPDPAPASWFPLPLYVGSPDDV